MENSSVNVSEPLFWYNAICEDSIINEKCPVCFDILDASSSIVTHTFPKDLTQASKHIYHLQCINKVVDNQLNLEQLPSCPLCSREVEHLSLKKTINKHSEVKLIAGLELQIYAKLLDPIILKSHHTFLIEDNRVRSKLRSNITRELLRVLEDKNQIIDIKQKHINLVHDRVDKILKLNLTVIILCSLTALFFQVFYD